MEVYICEKCNYYTQKLCNFKKHSLSKKHISNVFNNGIQLSQHVNHTNHTNHTNGSVQSDQSDQFNHSVQLDKNNQLNHYEKYDKNEKPNGLDYVENIDYRKMNQIAQSNQSNQSIKSIKSIQIEKIEKTKIYGCNKCNSFYVTNKSLQRHIRQSHNTKESIEKLKEENLRLKNELQKEINEKQDCKDLLRDAMLIAKENSSTANTSMNILKYAKLHLSNAEPLEQLRDCDISRVIGYKNPNKTEEKNETYVKIAIHKFNHGIFSGFIGDMIIEYYKPKTTKDANLIATDTSRLTFIIMQKITKGKIEQKEWINDKSGKKFTELVLEPLINAVKQTLIEFVEFKKKKELNENSLCLMAKCVELKRDIEVNKFTNPILRYVAPHFHFDKLKLLDDSEELNL